MDEPEDKEPTTDLSFVGTDELMAEIRKRSEAFIAVLVLKVDDVENETVSRYYYEGGPHTALGLSYRFAHWLNDYMDGAYENFEADEDNE